MSNNVFIFGIFDRKSGYKDFKRIFKEEGIRNEQVVEEILLTTNIEDLTEDGLREKVKL